jgi:signal transduction histidine kinase
MSVAHVALVERPPTPAREETVRELIHDLRQPLSSIEAIAYYLEMTLPAGQSQARHYMHRLQELVERSNEILEQAASDYKTQDLPARTLGAA